MAPMAQNTPNLPVGPDLQAVTMPFLLIKTYKAISQNRRSPKILFFTVHFQAQALGTSTSSDVALHHTASAGRSRSALLSTGAVLVLVTAMLIGVLFIAIVYLLVQHCRQRLRSASSTADDDDDEEQSCGKEDDELGLRRKWLTESMPGAQSYGSFA